MIRSISRISVKKDAHSPYIGANGNWWEWDAQLGRYKDTGVKAQGDRGPQGARPSVTVYRPNTLYYAGNEGEPVLDYVFYEGRYYRCTKTHISKANTNLENPFDEVGHGRDTWALETNHEFIATKVFFAGEDGRGWVFDEGVIRHTSGNITLTAAGIIETASGRYKVDENGKLWAIEADIKNSTLQDVRLLGTMRSPFVRHDGSITWDDTKSVAMLHDNLLMAGGGSWTLAAGGLPWDASQSGRRMTITTHRYNGSLSQGAVSFTAPSGKYFFEDGITRTELKLASREYVEMLGIGEESTFYGWLILNRGNIETNGKYGRKQNVLANGIVTYTGNGSNSHTCSINYKTFDDSKMYAYCLSTVGRYQITMPWTIDTSKYMVMLTPFGRTHGHTSDCPLKATLLDKNTSYFFVELSDDATTNWGGGFNFQIINLDDWTSQ